MGRLAWGGRVSAAGSYALFCAEMDQVVAFSACPWRATEALFSVE